MACHSVEPLSVLGDEPNSRASAFPGIIKVPPVLDLCKGSRSIEGRPETCFLSILIKSDQPESFLFFLTVL